MLSHQPFFIILGLLWMGSALFEYSEYTALLQLKEYRFDKFKDFLTTKEGKHFWRQYRLSWRTGLIAMILFFSMYISSALWYLYAILISIDMLHAVYRAQHHRLRRPVFTVKAIIVIGAATLVEAIIILTVRHPAVALLMLAARCIVVSIVVVSFSFPTRIIKAYYIHCAQTVILAHPTVTVIGITGSFGKTTVKTFLQHILEAQFRVAMTPKSINTDIGVAQSILRINFSEIDVLLVEMGAYRKGEIKKICDMVRPRIGILTAINEQHVALFGKIENIQEAKYELLRLIPATGLAIVNSDNIYCREGTASLAAHVETFGIEEEFHPTCLLKDVSADTMSMQAAFDVAGSSWKISAPIPGAHNAMNIAPCLLVARYLGLTEASIRARCQTLQLPPSTLTIKSYGKATVIDDSFNANPDGFRAALSVLSSFPSERKRIVITRGIPELGDEGDRIHETIGGDIAFSADELVLVQREFETSLRRGIGTKYRTDIVIKDDPEDLLVYVRLLKDQNVVVLIENRIFSLVTKELQLH